MHDAIAIRTYVVHTTYLRFNIIKKIKMFDFEERKNIQQVCKK